MNKCELKDMTSEQRNEIAMEVLDEVLMEATRYAKETHKKREKADEEYDRYSQMKDRIKEKIRSYQHLDDKPDEIKKWEKKLEEIKCKMAKAKKERDECDEKDTLQGPLDGMRSVTAGGINGRRNAAHKQPGRYSQYTYRHDVHQFPGFWGIN